MIQKGKIEKNIITTKKKTKKAKQQQIPTSRSRKAKRGGTGKGPPSTQERTVKKKNWTRPIRDRVEKKNKGPPAVHSEKQPVEHPIKKNSARDRGEQ